MRSRLGAPDPGTAKTDTLTIDLPIALKRRGIETKLVIEGGKDPSPNPDPALIKAVRSGAKLFEELRTGIAASVGDLVKRHGIDQGDVSRLLPLAFLAPDIVEAILDGRHPVDLTAVRLKRVRLPLAWPEQRRVLGFNDG